MLFMFSVKSSKKSKYSQNILTIITKVINQDDFSYKMLRTSVQNTAKKKKEKKIKFRKNKRENHCKIRAERPYRYSLAWVDLILSWLVWLFWTEIKSKI